MSRLLAPEHRLLLPLREIIIPSLMVRHGRGFPIRGVISEPIPTFPPASTIITATGAYTYSPPAGAHKIDYVLLGAGAGGGGGGFGGSGGGTGGGAGAWSSGTLIIGVDFSGNITGSVGGGSGPGPTGGSGAGSGPGGPTTLSATGLTTITASGGAASVYGYAGWGQPSPNPLTYNGHSFQAGTGPSQTGCGGQGGASNFSGGASGGGGGPGKAWFWAY